MNNFLIGKETVEVRAQGLKMSTMSTPPASHQAWIQAKRPELGQSEQLSGSSFSRLKTSKKKNATQVIHQNVPASADSPTAFVGGHHAGPRSVDI